MKAISLKLSNYYIAKCNAVCWKSVFPPFWRARCFGATLIVASCWKSEIRQADCWKGEVWQMYSWELQQLWAKCWETEQY